MQQTETITIGPAREEHASFVAWVMMAAARSHMPKGIWDFVAGPDESRILRLLTGLASTPQPHGGHYSQFLIAEVEGTPAAGLMGYFEGEHDMQSLGAALPVAVDAAGMTMEEFAAGFDAGRSMLNMQPHHEPGAWIIEHVATHPDFRRRGLIDKLLQAMMQRGRERGATICEVGVLIGNDGAQAAYEKAGFSVVEELLDSEFERVYGSPGERELRRTL